MVRDANIAVLAPDEGWCIYKFGPVAQAGTEIQLVYARQRHASRVPHLRSLVGFDCVTLYPSESAHIELSQSIGELLALRLQVFMTLDRRLPLLGLRVGRVGADRTHDDLAEIPRCSRAGTRTGRRGPVRRVSSGQYRDAVGKRHQRLVDPADIANIDVMNGGRCGSYRFRYRRG